MDVNTTSTLHVVKNIVNFTPNKLRALVSFTRLKKQIDIFK